MEENVNQKDIDKAVSNYLKRQEYNKAWRAKNVDKVKAMQWRYNHNKWIKEKELLRIARERGQL